MQRGQDYLVLAERSRREGRGRGHGRSRRVLDPAAGLLQLGADGAERGSAPRFTLTYSGDRVFARQGGLGRSSAGTSSIMAVRNNRDIEGKLIWQKFSNEIPLPKTRPDAPTRFSGVFEGTPVADSRNVYVGLTESATETSCYVACLDAETGAVRWVRFLGTRRARQRHDGLRRRDGRHGDHVGRDRQPLAVARRPDHLLSDQPRRGGRAGRGNRLDPLAGHLPDRAIPSCPAREREAQPGGRPRRARHHRPRRRPADLRLRRGDRPDGSGRPSRRWRSSRTCWAWPRGTWSRPAIGSTCSTSRTGKLGRAWPDGATASEGYGRGLLAGDSIYWPTKTDICVLDQATGAARRSRADPLKEHYETGGGNLAVGRRLPGHRAGQSDGGVLPE